jgi:hypothetical protein
LAERHRQDPQAHPEAPARFNWHALRHFAISCWIEADLKPKTVQTFAGHSCKIADNSDPLRGIYASNSDPF